MKPLKLLIVIPAYNPGPVLVDVARRAAVVAGTENVLVVDDGSADGSAAEAARTGVRVHRHEVNRGKGAALRTGYAEAIAGGYDACVTMDADGQHHPEWTERLLAGLSPDVDLVIGSRMTDTGPMPLLRVLTNRFMSRVLSGLIGQPVGDTQSGFRLIRRRVLEGVELTTDRFEAESELLIKAGRRGFRIAEVAIPAVYGEEKSKIRPVADTLRWIRLLRASRSWK